MVTAIVIPIICLYFYWLTKKEMRENDRKWLTAAEVREDAILTGEIKSITEEKQRFYYHRYVIIQEIKLQTETKIIKAKKITPLQKNTQIESFTIGEIIRLYGHWEGSHFHFNHYQQSIIK